MSNLNSVTTTPKAGIVVIIDAIDTNNSEKYGGAAIYGSDGKWYWAFNGEKTTALSSSLYVYCWRYINGGKN